MSRGRNRTTLAVIPARGGSKGIPGKNLATVGGKPLIAHTIAAACGASGVDRIVVTTDSEAIAEVSKGLGAECPFLRPSELATDSAPGRGAWQHTLGWLAEHEGYRPDRTVLLQPTSPLRTADDIDAALAMHAELDADWIVSVTLARHGELWRSRMSPDGRLTEYSRKSAQATQRQSEELAYLPNGAVYVATTEALMQSGTLYTDLTFGYVMPEARSLDVDTPWDLYLADLLLRARTMAFPECELGSCCSVHNRVDASVSL